MKKKNCFTFLQTWLDAIEEHSAYSTHYCSQEQGSEEEEEDEEKGMSLGELTDSLQVVVNKEIHNERVGTVVWMVFCEREAPGRFIPTSVTSAHLHLSHVFLNHQAAEDSHKKLEQEVAAFLSMLKIDELSERKTCYFTIITGGFFPPPVLHYYHMWQIKKKNQCDMCSEREQLQDNFTIILFISETSHTVVLMSSYLWVFLWFLVKQL